MAEPHGRRQLRDVAMQDLTQKGTWGARRLCRQRPKVPSPQPRLIGRPLFRGTEGDVDHACDARRRVVGVVPRLNRNARVAEEIRVVRDRRRRSVARSRDDVTVHVEHLPAGVVRIARLRSADVRARDVDVSVAGTRASGPPPPTL